MASCIAQFDGVNEKSWSAAKKTFVESSGNSLYLVCDPCSGTNEKDFGFKLCERGIIGAYEVFGPAKATSQLAAWLKKHQRCGSKGKPDHFKLAHLHAPNHDQPNKPLLTLKRVDGSQINGTVSPENQ